MNISTLKAPIETIRDFILLRPWLNGLIKLVGFCLAAVIVYRFLMSPAAKAIRAKIPWLASIFGHREIRNLIAHGEYAQAGDKLISLGQYRQAIDVFQKGNLYGRAADIYVRLRNLDKAAMMYERAGDFSKAAEIYLDRKVFDRAEANLEKAGKLEELGDFYLARGEKKRAAEAFCRSLRFDQAAKVFEEIEMYKEAAQALLQAETDSLNTMGFDQSESRPRQLNAARLLERAKIYDRAFAIFEKAQKWSDAARCMEKLGDLKKAAQLFEQGGDLERASELLSRGGDKASAARLQGEQFYQTGDLQQAVTKFQEAGDFLRAADLYRELNQMEKAAAMYERAREYALAASAYLQIQRYEEAGRAYERAHDWKEAIESYGLANQLAKQAQLQEKVEDYLGLAKNFHKRGLFDEALEALTKVKENPMRERSVLSLKGKILLDKGEPLKAKPFFEKALEGNNKLNGDDIETVYNLAVSADQSQTDSKALDILEQMLASGLVEKEAKEKAESVRKLLSERAFTKMSKAAMIPGSRVFTKSESALTEMTAASTKRYAIIKEIGHGGMGVVYEARDTNLDRIVALKILAGSFKRNEQAVRTFLREAKAAAALNHPNIVTVHDSGIQEGDYYIAMEFIEGRTIKEIIRARKKLSYPSVVEVLRQLFDALAYAHSKNVVHRDLTTNNIMWTKQKMVKIMDFGLAKIVKELMTEQSIIGGTPSFMSPEQTLGKPIDHRTDIYSVGICIFEMCLGELPFKSGDLGYHHLHTAPPNPKEKDPQMPDVFYDLIVKAMEKDPSKRFQSMAEMQSHLAKMT